MFTKNWIVAPAASPDTLRHYRNIHPLLAQVLYNRGFSDPDDAYRFLYAHSDEYGRDTLRPDYAPFAMKGMSQAVARIRQAIMRREPIVVYGDFDADGVTSTVLLVQTLRALNAIVSPYIPHRVDEGYGLNSEALYALAGAGNKLVITVDCGTRSVKEVEDGNAAGLDVIITDHHSIGPEVPHAVAIINPKQADCAFPEDMLAGVGVTFNLALALLAAANGQRDHHKPALTEDDLLDLVAIGTVADIVPLNRLLNRIYVKRGLKMLNQARRPGVRALLEVAGLKPGTVTAGSIGYVVGPRINAAGRLESAMLAYDLLAAPDMETALPLAQEIHALNTQRQDLTRATQEAIQLQLETELDGSLPLIFAAGADYQPGIVGLVAGRLAQDFYRPAIVMELGEEESRASCRSIPQFDITQALDQCADLLVRHGGHAQAAGFTVANGNIYALHERLLQIARDALGGQELAPILEIDAELDIHQLSEDLVSELEQLEPTGHMNPAPVFMSSRARVLEWRTVGRDDRHLKLKLARAGQPPLDAIGFGLGEWVLKHPDYIDVAYYLEINEWNGWRSLQLNLQDIRPSTVG